MKKIFLLFIFTACAFHLHAQQKEITGTITGSDFNAPLPGVNIVIEGTTTGTITDLNGNYSITVPFDDAVLIISSVGYLTEKVVIGQQSTINLTLVQDIQALNEVIVVGYGTQSKRSVTGSVVSVKSDEFEDRSHSNVMQSLAGKLPGVKITQSQGAPGSSPIIKIRGSSSITAGTTPLYVVDGLPMENFNLNNINPQDIESIEILKDASSAAIYGSRGANGVVLISTRLGKPGATNVSINYEFGIQEVTRTVDMMDAQQFIDYYITAHNNAWVAAGGNAGDPNEVRENQYRIPEDFINNPGIFGSGTDWQDVLFNTAPSHNLQLSVSGGTDKTQFLISGGYLDQEAVVDNNYYKRLSTRVNVRQKVNDKLVIGGNLAFTNIKDRTDGTNGKVDVVSLAMQSDPIFPVYNENGNLGFKDPNSTWYRFASYSDLQLWHPYSMTREIDKKNSTFNTIGTAYFEYDILDNLKFRSSLSGNIYNSRFNSYQNALRKYGYSNAVPAEGSSSSSYMFNWLTENTLRYEKQLSDHNIVALIGYTAQKQRDEYSYLKSNNFPNDLVHTLNAGTVTTGTSIASEWSMLSYLTRVNYNYQEKYYLTGTIRRDGSSRFGSNNKWGYFPSISGAWLISEEAFMQSMAIISYMKLKTSYGLTGNNQIPNYGAISLLGSSTSLSDAITLTNGGANYANGSDIANGLFVTTIANPDLKWERTAQFNIGIETGMFDNRVYFGAEFYNSVTNDLLLYLPVPDVTGFSTQLTNIGKLRNAGFEFLVTTHNLVGKFKWITDFNFSLNRNKVLELGPEDSPIIFTEWNVCVKTEVDQPISNFYGYQFDGVYNTQAEIDASTHVEAATPGDPIIRDVNGDGIISDLDKTTLGNAQPDFISGVTNTFTYQGIELSVMLQGSFGGEIVNQQWRYDGRWNGGRNLYADVADYWKSPSDPGDGVHFKPTINNIAFQTQFSNLWVEDATYMRVKNIRLSYTLPDNILSRLAIASTRIYVNVENAFLFTDYSGYDPENTSYNATTYSATGRYNSGTSVGDGDTYNSITSTSALPTGAMLGVDFGSYPVPRVFTFGVNIEF